MIFFLTDSLVIKDSITQNLTIQTSTNQDAVYVHSLNLFLSFFPPPFKSSGLKINSDI